MSQMNPKVDGYLKRSKWREELEELRRISLACGLTEELKWGKPCYTFQNSNIVILQGFKEFCALLFPKGALLKGPKDILKQFGWQAARRIPLTNVREIVTLERVLKAYIKEAIAAEKAGLKVVLKKNPEPIPEELQNRLAEDRALKTAFSALTPGRQRGYILHFSGAKQSKTRESRIEKWMPHILNGKGLND